MDRLSKLHALLGDGQAPIAGAGAAAATDGKSALCVVADVTAGHVDAS
jgi:hypothetical protein